MLARSTQCGVEAGLSRDAQIERRPSNVAVRIAAQACDLRSQADQGVEALAARQSFLPL
jgi:hypothetical protein